jgi:hypothetical protein
VYAVFSRSFVANEQFEEVVRVTNGNALAHWSLNELRWLSRHFTESTLIRNSVLIDLCTEWINAAIQWTNNAWRCSQMHSISLDLQFWTMF